MPQVSLTWMCRGSSSPTAVVQYIARRSDTSPHKAIWITDIGQSTLVQVLMSNETAVGRYTDVVLRIDLPFGRSKVGPLPEGVHTPKAYRPADKAEGLLLTLSANPWLHLLSIASPLTVVSTGQKSLSSGSFFGHLESIRLRICSAAAIASAIADE